MGSRQANFYNALAVRMGFGDAAATVQDLYLSRRHRDAMAAVPYEFIDATSLLGPRERLAEKLAALAAAGVTTCAVAPVGDSVEEKLHGLTVVTRGLRAGRGRRLAGRQRLQHAGEQQHGDHARPARSGRSRRAGSCGC